MDSNVKIYKLATRFIDIEVPRDSFSIDCFDMDPTDKTALTVFHIVNGNSYHTFNYRSILPKIDCLSDLLVYEKIFKAAEKVRIVGITLNDMSKDQDSDKSIPQKFRGKAIATSWTFIRLPTSKGCEPYFKEDCVPANYWAGLIPE